MLDCMSEVAQAWKECRVLRIVYPDRKKREGFCERDIEVYSFDDTYIDALCRLRGDKRTFRVDRILEVRLLEERFQRHPALEARVEREGWSKGPIAAPEAVTSAPMGLPAPRPEPTFWRRVMALVGLGKGA